MAPTNEREKYGVKEGAKSTTIQLLGIYWLTLDNGCSLLGQFFSMDRDKNKIFHKRIKCSLGYVQNWSLLTTKMYLIVVHIGK